jgi:hypothetical protein
MSTIQNSGGHLTYPNLPVFHIDATGSSGGGGQDLTLTTTPTELTVFDSVRVNRGNHFNTTTGRFTAPTAGVYEFYMFFITGNASDVYRFNFYKNGSNLGKQLRLDTSDTTNTDYEIGSMKIYEELAKDDYVSIYGYSTGGSNAFVDPSGVYSFFAGRLIG